MSTHNICFRGQVLRMTGMSCLKILFVEAEYKLLIVTKLVQIPGRDGLSIFLWRLLDRTVNKSMI